MSIQKSIIDRFGAAHTASYTRIYQIFLYDAAANVFVGIYHDAASRSKGTPGSEKAMLEQSMLSVGSSDFNTYFQDSVLDNNAVSPLKQAYAWLKTQTDALGQNWTTGTTDV